MRKSFTMFQSLYAHISNQYRKEHPDVSDRELRIVMAKRLYGGDPRTMVLIEMAERELKERNEH
jgi:hypothetical protein